MGRRRPYSTAAAHGAGTGGRWPPPPAGVARSGAERAGRGVGIVQVCSAKQQKARLNGEKLPMPGKKFFSWTGRGPFSFSKKRMGGGTVPSAGTAGTHPSPGRRKREKTVPPAGTAGFPPRPGLKNPGNETAPGRPPSPARLSSIPTAPGRSPKATRAGHRCPTLVFTSSVPRWRWQ